MARVPLPPIPSRFVDVEVAAEAGRTNPVAALIPAAVLDGDGDGVAGDGDGVAGGGARRPVCAPADVDLAVRSHATGKAGEVHRPAAGQASPRWLVGAGALRAAQSRSAGAALARAIDSDLRADEEAGARTARTVALRLPSGLATGDVAALATGVMLGAYDYRVSGAGPKLALRTLRLIVAADDFADPAELGDVLARARALAEATIVARDLANTPSNVKDPAWLAGTAQRLSADSPNLRVDVRDERWLTEQRFGGLLAVGGGSASPPRLIELSYRPRGASTHLLLVGKGITFDTGGLSIKPAAGMNMMRTDMAGGGAVVAAVRAIAALRLPVRVTALVPAAENHVSGSAYRPGDIVRHYGGMTTEVTNTDAEGRMVLADALAYGVRRFDPDAVVDVATLTGAMKVALGMRTGGVFATEDVLAERVRAAGEAAGEAWWRMPLLEEHAAAVRSEIADIRQAPEGPGGIAAALFLREFTGARPWAHLDIAGPARAESNYAEVVQGGTGFAARTLVELVASYA